MLDQLTSDDEADLDRLAERFELPPGLLQELLRIVLPRRPLNLGQLDLERVINDLESVILRFVSEQK